MSTEGYINASAEEGLVLAIGTALQAQIAGVSERISGVLVGVVAGECLIIRGQFDSLEGLSVEGQRATVHYIQQGARKAFAGEWIGAITSPVELAFIKYPEEIETIELRAHKREECFLPADIKIRNEVYSGIVQDISEKGCRFILDVSGGGEAPAIGKAEQVIVVVHLPEAEEKEEIAGEVRNAHFAAEFDTEEMHVGIEFQDETPESLKRIAENIMAAEPF